MPDALLFSGQSFCFLAIDSFGCFMLVIPHNQFRCSNQCMEFSFRARSPVSIGLLFVVLLALVSGCTGSSGPLSPGEDVVADGTISDGSDNGGSTADGDGNINVPVVSDPEQSDGPVIVTQGQLTQSEELTVSGRTFNLDNADIVRRGELATFDALMPGMQLTIRSDDRNASSVIYEVDVSGPVDSVGLDGSLSIMGQQILTNDTTTINHVFLNDFNVGDAYEISGLRNDSQDIVASYIERQLEAPLYEVTGRVTNLDLQISTFSLQDLTINYADADISALPASGIAEGMNIQVKDTQASYEPGSLFLSATELNPASIDLLAEGNEIEYEIDGIVTNIENEDTFSLRSNRVVITDNTRFTGGSRTDLIPGSRIEVEGDFDIDNVLEAWEVEFPGDGGIGGYADFNLNDVDVSEPGVDPDITDPTDGDVAEPINDDDSGDETDIPAADSNSGGCQDFYDSNGTVREDIDSRTVLPESSTIIERSLCGAFDADFVEFSGKPNASYRIDVLRHLSPEESGVYLRLLEQGADGSFQLVNRTSAGNTLIGFTNGSAEKTYVVRVGSTESDEGRYGGGNYVLSITSN